MRARAGHCAADTEFNLCKRDELPRSKPRGIEKLYDPFDFAQGHGEEDRTMIIFPKVVTPECFYRGSSPSLAWIPAKSMRE